jgi:Gluconate 2-dehydrogenase subunit 3
MNRRTAIRNVVVISAGATLLPSCLQQDSGTLSLKNISLSGSQEKMLAELAETIIPKTITFPGAKDINTHEFILTMVDDCSSPEEQQKFTRGMKTFEDACKKKVDNSFVNATAQQRKEFLQLVEKKQDIPEEATGFYGTVKRYTVQSFTSSKQYMTDIRKYKMVPGGNYKGCVPVKGA